MAGGCGARSRSPPRSWTSPTPSRWPRSDAPGRSRARRPSRWSTSSPPCHRTRRPRCRSPPGSKATGASRTGCTPGPRRHLRRRPLMRANRERAPGHGQPALDRDQRPTPDRDHQHRPSHPTPRPQHRPARPAHAQLRDLNSEGTHVRAERIAAVVVRHWTSP